MKLLKFSVVAFVILFSVQFAKAQTISVGATFGGHYPHTRVLIANAYPSYGYYNRPVYYRYRGYYRRPYVRYYHRPVYYRPVRHYRHW
ncbi:MAG: hypothetical protein AAGC65_14200 [Mucilaginibacter sp.]|uniref:hypothetical protein n=1 Tax=Mucilaginibacter sp. TaxID=1882438 RepID=UPI0031A1F847